MNFGNSINLKIFWQNNQLTLDGIKVTKLVIANQLTDCNNYINSNWRQILESSGQSSIIFYGEGLICDSKTEQIITSLVLNKGLTYCNIEFLDLSYFAGKFAISNFERNFTQQQVEKFKIKLESSGQIMYSHDRELNN